MFPHLTKLCWGRLLWIERQKKILFLEVFQETAPGMPPNVMVVSKLDAFIMGTISAIEGLQYLKQNYQSELSIWIWIQTASKFYLD